MNRGARRAAIFQSYEQRAYFLSLLAATSERLNAEWHAYCLMGNHYHLLLRTPEGNLQRIMRHVNGLYTQYFNRTQGRDGPLFRGRYKAALVDAQAHWLGLSRYVHRNPLEARMTDDLAAYPWSSYAAYVGRSPAPDWLLTDYVLGAIKPRPYAKYVEGNDDNEAVSPYATINIPSILGDDDFARSVLMGRAPTVDEPELRQARPTPSIDRIVEAACRHFDVPAETLMRKHQRKEAPARLARAATMYLCQRVGAMTLAQIAKGFGLASYASASASIRRFEAKIEQDSGLGQAVKLLILDLTP
ncbi:MAG: transposase [Nitrococcus sp.]|nr:transposase [Nitrococcus sp.]